AGISADHTVGCAPLLVNFTNTSTPLFNGVNLASFVFTFHNGTTQSTSSVATNVNHTYTTEGTFPVTLVVTDAFGCVSPPTSISITLTKPTAIFSIDSVVCAGEQVSTVNASTGVGPLSYQWFVNGGQVGIGSDYTSQYSGTTGTSSTQY